MEYLFKTTLSRSRNMRAIKYANNRTTERRIRAHLVQLGVRGWRLRTAALPGRPDFTFANAKVAVFVDGCFWHGCRRCGHIPRTNRAYWLAKITRNKRRDRAVSKALRTQGYHVLRIRECQLRTNPKQCVGRILSMLNRYSGEALLDTPGPARKNAQRGTGAEE